MQNSPTNTWLRAAIDVLQWILLAGMLVFYALFLEVQVAAPFGTDYAKFYYAAFQALHGRPLYAVMDSAVFGIRESLFYQFTLVLDPPLHMPQVVAAYIPLALLPFSMSYRIWYVFSLAAGLGSCAICWRVLYRPRGSRRVLLWMWIAFLGFFPTFTAVRLGQGALAFFLLATIAWWSVRNGHTRRGGIALGIAVSLRSFGALLLVYFLIKRQWRLLFWSAGAYAATLAASLPLVGLDSYDDWLNVMRGVAIQGRNWNASLSGFFSRLLAPEPALLLTAAGSLLGLGLLVWLSWPARHIQPDTDHDDLTFSLALALMLLLSPLGWMYYFPILFLALFVIWRQTASPPQRKLRWALLPAWLLSNIPTIQHQTSELTDPLAWWTWNSVYFYALLIIVGMLVVMAAPTPAEVNVPDIEPASSSGQTPLAR
jgi:hypothetical protein